MTEQPSIQNQQKAAASAGFWLSTLPIAMSQTIFWASTYYLLPALILELEQGTEWSKSAISFAMSGMIVTSALGARPMGKLIDRGQGPRVMALSGACAGGVLILASFATNYWVFLICCMTIGLAMAAILYEPCFSIVTRHYGLNARAVITHITLVAGFAGTISFPAANWLSHAFDWQTAFQVFGFFVLFVATPMAWFGFKRLENALPFVSENSTNSGDTLETIRHSRNRSFWFIAIAFLLGVTTHSMIVSHILPLLDERGIATQMAVLAAMLIGPMQVVGRIMLMASRSHLTNRLSAIISFAGLTFASGLLLIADTTISLIFIAMALHGATWGLVSITRPALIREVLGAKGFGATSGTIATFATLGVASAPSLGALIWSFSGYTAMLAVGMSLSLVGSVLMIALSGGNSRN